MPRTKFGDPLQSHCFWLMDVGPSDTMGMPILTPLFGFSAITAPEISLETQDVNEGNWYFTRKVVRRGSIGNITLSRGVFFYDNDFWRWIIASISGDMTSTSFAPIGLGDAGPTPRRTLMLIQFFASSGISDNPLVAVTELGGVAGLAVMAAGVGGVNPIQLAAGVAASVGLAAATALTTNVGPFQFAIRVPARAYVLQGAIPVRYKAGTDMAGDSSAVHVAELELAVDMFEEITLGG